MRHACLAAAVLAAAAAVPAMAKDPVPLTDANVEKAIERGVAFIWSLQNQESHWEKESDAEWARIQRARGDKAPGAMDLNRGGRTALALLGLLHGGASVEDERFVKAVKWLAEQDPPGTYALGVRAALWAELHQAGVKGAHRMIERDGRTLERGIWPYGTYNYQMRPEDNLDDRPKGDFSNTQYGILGVWAASESGVEIHPKYWLLALNGYLEGQNRDGGWSYQTVPDHKHKAGLYPGSRDGLTLGGIATLFVIWDHHFASGDCDRRVDPKLLRSLTAAVEWADKEFTKRKKAGMRHIEPYTLYGLERAGVAGGLKYFGEFDWYADGAQLALNNQRPTGEWGTGHHFPECGTAWTIMFLAYGRAPVVFNKLAWGRMEDWNARPRDLANLTRQMGRVFEQKFNWQVMPISADQADLQDAPILYVTSRGDFRFTDAEKARLRDYVLGGGTLLLSPAGRAATFDRAAAALVNDLFPQQELVPVPGDAPPFTAQFPIAPAVPMKGLHNGIRWTVLVSGVDLGCPWQRREVARRKNLFDLAGNLYAYVSDKGRLQSRGQSYLPDDAGNKPPATLNVARLMWAGPLAADPEPKAWTFADRRLRNAGVAAVATRATDLSDPLDPAGTPLLHVTGIGAIKLDEKAKANLKAYVQAGGLVLIDAAGGDEKFADSARTLLADVFGADALVPAPADLPALQAATDADGKTWFRHRFDLPRALRPLDVLAVMPQPGKPGVLFLPYDLSSAMVGYPSMAPAGLDPESADRFIRALAESLTKPAKP